MVKPSRGVRAVGVKHRVLAVAVVTRSGAVRFESSLFIQRSRRMITRAHLQKCAARPGLRGHLQRLLEQGGPDPASAMSWVYTNVYDFGFITQEPQQEEPDDHEVIVLRNEQARMLEAALLRSVQRKPTVARQLIQALVLGRGRDPYQHVVFPQAARRFTNRPLSKRYRILQLSKLLPPMASSTSPTVLLPSTMARARFSSERSS